MVGDNVVQLRGIKVAVPHLTDPVVAAVQDLLVIFVPDLRFEVDIQVAIELVLKGGDVIVEQILKTRHGKDQITTASG